MDDVNDFNMDDVKGLNHQIEILRSRLADTTRNRSEIQENFKDLQVKYTTLVKTYNDVLNRDFKDITELKRKVECYEHEIDSYKDEVNDLNERLANCASDKEKAVAKQKEWTELYKEALNDSRNKLDRQRKVIRGYRSAVGILVAIIAYWMAMAFIA